MSVRSLLGIAQKAGRLVSGFDAVHRAVDRGRAKLVLVSQDASVKTVERVRQIADARQVPMISWGSMRALGEAIGRPDRAVVAVLDPQLAEAVQKAFSRGE